MWQVCVFLLIFFFNPFYHLFLPLQILPLSDQTQLGSKRILTLMNSFKNYLLIMYYIPGLTLGSMGTVMSKIDTISATMKALSLGGRGSVIK